MAEKPNLGIEIDPDLLNRMVKFIDGIRYRSKRHFTEVAILDLLERQEITESEILRATIERMKRKIARLQDKDILKVHNYGSQR